jgi:hypothetical protein
MAALERGLKYRSSSGRPRNQLVTSRMSDICGASRPKAANSSLNIASPSARVESCCDPSPNFIRDRHFHERLLPRAVVGNATRAGLSFGIDSDDAALADLQFAPTVPESALVEDPTLKDRANLSASARILFHLFGRIMVRQLGEALAPPGSDQRLHLGLAPLAGGLGIGSVDGAQGGAWGSRPPSAATPNGQPRRASHPNAEMDLTPTASRDPSMLLPTPRLPSQASPVSD